MDYGALPPEINSARMYAGPGPESMLAAATAWDGLAALLHSGAAAYTSAVSGLTDGPWVGPSSAAMAAAAAPYAAWMSTTAGQAELAATQAKTAAGAYETAFAMTVPPPEIAANRAQLTTLVSTNFLGQNTPAIAATEAQYGEMWAQDAAAMYGYAATSAATTAKVTPFTAAPQTTNLAGVAAQGAANAQATGTSTGTGVQSTLSQLVSAVPTALQSLASPATSSTGSSTTGLLGDLAGSSSGFSLSGVMQGVVTSYATIPGFFAMFMGSNALGPLMNPDVFLPFMNMNAAAAAAPLGAGAAAGAAAAGGALGSGFAGGLGGLGGLGKAAAVGALSVPSTWGWAATGPAAMLGTAPMLAPAAAPLAGADLGAGLGFPFMFGGLPGAAASGAAGTGTAVKYGLPLAAVMARPPGAGYGRAEASAPTPAYPVPAGFPTNGHAPPGYTPAIVYLPTNGHEKADV